MILNIVCLVRFLSDSDRDCLEAACIPANLNSAVECSRSRGESASTKTLLLRMPHAWAPCSQWHTGLPFSSSVACFKTPVQCHECAKCRCQCFLLHLRKGRNASAMDIMSVIAFRSKDMFIFSLFGSKLALDPEGSARANTIHNGKTIKNDRICRKMQSRHVNWKKFNATLPSSASKLWFRKVSTPAQHFSALDLCPESLPLVLARLTED